MYFHRKVLLVALFAVFVISNSALAYLTNIFNAKYLTNDADRVYKIRVISVKEDGVYTDNHFSPPLTATKMVAHAEVQSVIKGLYMTEIDIAYPKSTSMVGFTPLSPEEVCIVFLKGTRSPFKYFDLHNGKMAATLQSGPECLGLTVQDKLLGQLLVSANTLKGKAQLEAIEELGKLGDFRATSTLRKIADTDDIVVRSLSLTARIQVGDAPCIADLLAILKIPKSDFDKTQSCNKYRTTGYSVGDLQRELLWAIEQSVVPSNMYSVPSVNPPISKLEGFDYADFFKQALNIDSVRKNTGTRRCRIATLRKLGDEKSIPDK